MGNVLCKKQEEKHPTSSDIEIETTKEATAKKEPDVNHEKANALSENLNDTANTSEGQGPTQPICHHMEPSIGDEAVSTRMHQVPAADAPENREESIHQDPVIAPVQLTDKEVVGHVTKENLHIKEAQGKTKINKSQKSNCVPAQQGCSSMEGNAIKKHNEPQQIPQPSKADDGNTCIQKVNVKAPQVPVVKGIPTAAPNDAATCNPTSAPPDTRMRLQKTREVSPPQDAAVKPKETSRLEGLRQNQSNTGNVTMEKEKAEGRWHPFTVNQSCPHEASRQPNLGKGLPPNVQKWIYERPNHLRELPRITTARLAACITLRKIEEEEGEDSHQ